MSNDQTFACDTEVVQPNPGWHGPKSLLIFDGECRFCRSQIAFLKRLDVTSKLEFLSLHDARVSVLLPDLSFEQLMEQMWLLTPNGKRFGGAEVIRFLSRSMPLLFPIAPLMHIPFSMPLWQWLYGIVARYRYKIAGKSCDGGTCHVHFGPPKQPPTSPPK